MDGSDFDTVDSDIMHWIAEVVDDMTRSAQRFRSDVRHDLKMALSEFSNRLETIEQRLEDIAMERA